MSGIARNGIKMEAMEANAAMLGMKVSSRSQRKTRNRLAALTLIGLALCVPAHSQPHKDRKSASLNHIAAPVSLSADEGVSVIAAALDAHVKTSRQRDCSHLVQAIYNQAGFPYAYASSSDLYAGTDDFLRVTHPQPGDLVVWPGHVGIVVNPAQHVFYSRLRHGPGIDDYDSDYWQTRGDARFYRYVTTTPVRAAERHK
jgi:cell wall-associated NlpC family hydrolase